MEEIIPEDSALPEDLESLLLEADQPPVVKPRRRLADVIQGARRYIVWLTFIAGLVLGWVGIGWWLWPVQWTNSNPWQLAPQHQRTYVTLVAQEYSRTTDVSRAKQALEGWDRKELIALITAMKAETTDAEAREQLAALAEAMDIPGSPNASLASLLGSTGVIVSLLLSVSLLVVAGVIVAAPRWQPGSLSSEAGLAEGEASEAELEELLAGIELEGQAVQEGQGQEGGPGPGQKEKEEGEDEEKDNEQEEQPAEDQQPLGDLLSLFEEEDTSLSALEAFCKGMPDVKITDLIDNIIKVSKQLRDMNTQPRRV